MVWYGMVVLLCLPCLQYHIVYFSIVWQNAGVLIWQNAGATIWQRAGNIMSLYGLALYGIVVQLFLTMKVLLCGTMQVL